jgi:SAM-dependent methyltransferase
MSFYHGVYRLLPEFLKRRINPLDHAIEDFVRGAGQFRPGGVVLDAGAGESRFAPFFAGHFYVALDSCVGDPAWDYRKIHLAADLSALPLAAQCADVVINTQVLEHVRQPGAVLKEIHRVLKPGGRLYLTAPQGWHEHQQPNDYYRFTRYSLRSLLEAAGFHHIEIASLGGYFHYLGHRLSYVPKVLFTGLPGALRILLLPVELIVLTVFCFVLPVLCFYLDPLDRTREFTLCYRCLAVKDGAGGHP